MRATGPTLPHHVGHLTHPPAYIPPPVLPPAGTVGERGRRSKRHFLLQGNGGDSCLVVAKKGKQRVDCSHFPITFNGYFKSRPKINNKDKNKCKCRASLAAFGTRQCPFLHSLDWRSTNIYHSLSSVCSITWPQVNIHHGAAAQYPTVDDRHSGVATCVAQAAS